MAMLIPQEAKECPVCYESFDINNRLPMLLECIINFFSFI
jgi:hypothetical protein